MEGEGYVVNVSQGWHDHAPLVPRVLRGRLYLSVLPRPFLLCDGEG